jgi:hypothetical protein
MAMSSEVKNINNYTGNFSLSIIQQVNIMVWQASFSQQMLVTLKIYSALAQEISDHHS